MPEGSTAFLQWLLTAALIPALAYTGKRMFDYLLQGNQHYVASLEMIVKSCREERDAFIAVIDGTLREHNETSRDIARSISEMRAELMQTALSRREGERQ